VNLTCRGNNAELQLRQEHVVGLEARPPDDNGEGELTIRDLFTNALRMRPDRIVVGEVRGGEALDMVQAMISGHPGSMTTLHANDPLSALLRLELLCRMNAVGIPADVARLQVGAAVDLIVQLARDARGTRRVVEIAEVASVDPAHGYRLRPLLRTRAAKGASAGQLSLEPTGEAPGFRDRIHALGLSSRVRHCAKLIGMAP
jgi:pilus assembly protein CpaF